MSYYSKSAAVATLKRFFAQQPTADRVTVKQILEASGRQQKSKQANMAWLSNKLLALRYHNLITADYSYLGRRRLEAVTLTIEGKKTLGRLATHEPYKPEKPQSHNISTSLLKPTLADALAIVTRLQKAYPEYQISLRVEPKTKTS